MRPFWLAGVEEESTTAYLDGKICLDIFPVANGDHERTGRIPAVHAGSLQDPAAIRDQRFQRVVGQVIHRYPTLRKLGADTIKIPLTLTVSSPRLPFLDDADNWHKLLPSRCMHGDFVALLQP